MTVVTERSSRIDRRLDDRQDSLRGLARWLESARRSLGFDALAIADPTGCLVVGAGSAHQCEELAAAAPLSVDLAGIRGPTMSSLASGAMWLCAPSPVSSDTWQTVARGCLRILGWTEAS